LIASLLCPVTVVLVCLKSASLLHLVVASEEHLLDDYHFPKEGVWSRQDTQMGGSTKKQQIQVP
jgi:hypothetical protein